VTPEAGESVYQLDSSVRRLDSGRVVLGGSPLKLLRLTAGGAAILDRCQAGQPVTLGPKAREVVERLVDDGILHPRPTSSAYTAADVTVVIPVRDKPDGLAATLWSLGPVKGVVVVDDGSVDADSHRRVADGAGAKVLTRAQSGGPAAARNTGLAEVDTPLVAFVDAGCTPEPGWLDGLLAHLGDDSLALVAPRIGGPRLDPREHPPIGGHLRESSGGRPGALGRYESVRSSLDLGALPSPVRPRARVPYVPAACLLGRTHLLRSLGGFAPSMTVGEDVDLIWRLVEAGYRVRYVPEVRVGHDDRTRWWPWARRRFDYGKSAAPLARRHPGNLRPLGISGWTAAVWALAAGGRIDGAAILATGTAVALAARLKALEHPAKEGFRLTGQGHLGAARVLASALTRTWWPVATLAAVRSKRVRRLLMAAAVGPALVDWWQQRPPLDPIRWTAIRLADDVAYGTGVWAGCVKEGVSEPLVPSFANWPGRTSVRQRSGGRPVNRKHRSGGDPGSIRRLDGIRS
jgi:mycofactocin system glycosyltransferase